MAQTRVEWVATTPTASWATQPGLRTTSLATATAGPADAEINLTQPLQTIDGFGTCFNELGWTALSALSKSDRARIMRELFALGG